MITNSIVVQWNRDMTNAKHLSHRRDRFLLNIIIQSPQCISGILFCYFRHFMYHSSATCYMRFCFLLFTFSHFLRAFPAKWLRCFFYSLTSERTWANRSCVCENVYKIGLAAKSSHQYYFGSFHINRLQSGIFIKNIISIYLHFWAVIGVLSCYKVKMIFRAIVLFVNFAVILLRADAYHNCSTYERSDEKIRIGFLSRYTSSKVITIIASDGN
jgi:hypothetical protein